MLSTFSHDLADADTAEQAITQWPTSQFTAFDIAPVDLVSLKLEQRARVQVVQGNMHDNWPFANGSFDFVRLSCIGSGVPEASWAHVMSEASRVAVPHIGRIQYIDVNTLIKLRGLYNVPVIADGDASTTISREEAAKEQALHDAITQVQTGIVELAESRNISAYPASTLPFHFTMHVASPVIEKKTIARKGSLSKKHSTDILGVSDLDLAVLEQARIDAMPFGVWYTNVMASADEFDFTASVSAICESSSSADAVGIAVAAHSTLEPEVNAKRRDVQDYGKR